jgi:hypothetical protein
LVQDFETQHVIFRDDEGLIHELWWATGQGWHHGNISKTTNAPVCGSDFRVIGQAPQGSDIREQIYFQAFDGGDEIVIYDAVPYPPIAFNPAGGSTWGHSGTWASGPIDSDPDPGIEHRCEWFLTPVDIP